MTPPSSAEPPVLFLYLRTGGGHLAPARAVASALERVSGGRVHGVLVDGLARAPAIATWTLEEGYRILQARARWYYEFLYLANKLPLLATLNARLTAPFVTPWLRSEILRTRPARIVVAHFLLIEPVIRILERERLDIPVSVMVTDPFTAHPLWFRHRTPEFILFSEELRRHAVTRGIPAERCAVFPFVLAERYSRRMTAEEAVAERRARGFEAGRPLVLILGGADGIPRGAAILRALVRGLPRAQVAIVCGRNASLERTARRIAAATGRTDVHVYGFVDFAYELITCADVVISKCGASTFMEILHLGRIPVITTYLWEQEKGNRDFLLRTETGFYENTPGRLPALVSRLLDPAGPAEEVRERIRLLHLRNGAPLVAQHLAG
jgi:processive 1,2-diacylglycerol beta-glucosyltransferase/1,2-diacylglycerol 3-beta-galactosyltransferase